jgi:hypothetical protein
VQRKSAKSVSQLGILLGIQIVLFMLRLTASRFVPEPGICTRINHIAFVIPRETIILALWCIWLPAIVISVITLYEQRRDDDFSSNSTDGSPRDISGRVR